MEEIKEIEKRIQVLKEELENVQGTKTEVYSRIVGYYRSVKNWNKGKSAEYAERTNYEIPKP